MEDSPSMHNGENSVNSTILMRKDFYPEPVQFPPIRQHHWLNPPEPHQAPPTASFPQQHDQLTVESGRRHGPRSPNHSTPTVVQNSCLETSKERDAAKLLTSHIATLDTSATATVDAADCCLRDKALLDHKSPQTGSQIFEPGSTGMPQVLPRYAGAPDAVERGCRRRAGRVLAAAAPPSIATPPDVPHGPLSLSWRCPAVDSAPNELDATSGARTGVEPTNSAEDASAQGAFQGGRCSCGAVFVFVCVGLLAVLINVPSVLPSLGDCLTLQLSYLLGNWHENTESGASITRAADQKNARGRLVKFLFPLVGQNRGATISGSDYRRSHRLQRLEDHYLKELDEVRTWEQILQGKINRRK